MATNRARGWLEPRRSRGDEDRALPAPDASSTTTMLPYSRSALLDVNTSNALRVADAYACVRVLVNADA